MDKKIIPALILSMSASAACAGETSVALYGRIDTGIGYRKIDAPGYDHSHIGVVSGGQSGSRWGLKGSEDLGDGLRVLFQVESGYTTTNGKSAQSGRLFGRQAIVGLKSSRWGRLDLGRQTNIASKYYVAIDPFALAFSVANIGVALSAANTNRLDNMVLYQSPKFNGFDFGTGYSFNVSDTSSSGFETANNIRAITSGVRYASGPLYVAATYDQMNGNNAVGDDATPRMYSVGGTYDFEIVKLALAFARTKDGWFVATNPSGGSDAKVNLSGNSFASGFEANSYVAGLTVPISGATKVFGSWQHVDPKNGNLSGDDQSMNVYSVGATYNLSKRTNLYAYASRSQNYAFLDDVKASAVGVGLRHFF